MFFSFIKYIEYIKALFMKKKLSEVSILINENLWYKWVCFISIIKYHNITNRLNINNSIINKI